MDGNLDRKLRNMQGKSPKQKIAELEKKLREAEKKVMIWETAMEIIEEEFHIDVKKVSNQIPETCLKKYGQKIRVTDLKKNI